jgi:phospholipase/carboxylesterase
MAIRRSPRMEAVVTPPPTGSPTSALILIHGRGADAGDLEPLLSLLDPDRRLLAIFPRGPLSLPPGGRHWYVVREVGFPDPGTFLPTFADLGASLDEILAEHAMDWSRTALGGFSQGAVMSYALGLGKGRPRPAAILAFSGFLPTVEGFELDLPSRAGLPVSITHGSQDPVIRVEFGREARAALEGARLDVSYREDSVGHTIAPGALAQAITVLGLALA